MRAIDAIGIKCGHLTVLALPIPAWNLASARCRCGAVVTTKLSDLLRGKKKSCGDKECRLKSDLTGKIFGELTVINYSGANHHGQARYVVECSCGVRKEIYGKSIMNGTRSCGHVRRDTSRRRAVETARDGGGRFLCA